MRLRYRNSVCRKCPYNVWLECDHRKKLNKKIRKKLGSEGADLHLIHHCSRYRSLFRTGDQVCIDLYHYMPLSHGKKQWGWKLAFKDFPGVVAGFKDNMFLIELQYPQPLVRPSSGKNCGQNQKRPVVKPFLLYKKAARFIRMVDVPATESTPGELNQNLICAEEQKLYLKN